MKHNWLILNTVFYCLGFHSKAMEFSNQTLIQILESVIETKKQGEDAISCYVQLEDVNQPIPVAYCYSQHMPLLNNSNKELDSTPVEPIKLDCTQKILNILFSIIKACSLKDDSFIADNCSTTIELKAYPFEDLINLTKLASHLKNEKLTRFIGSTVPDHIRTIYPISLKEYKKKLKKLDKETLNHLCDLRMIQAKAQKVFSSIHEINFDNPIILTQPPLSLFLMM